ncbi:hypothetical protein MTR_4g010610 [Medicago truncatula]|uniref:Uncharacterized protein n=1 Tax=Medicago truncatula TaxID=3880 RepID=G7JI46_MEDTR|nr:hypothetical protein MTR_4g010610 [Medicago truncatula]
MIPNTDAVQDMCCKLSCTDFLNSKFWKKTESLHQLIGDHYLSKSFHFVQRSSWDSLIVKKLEKQTTNYVNWEKAESIVMARNPRLHGSTSLKSTASDVWLDLAERIS